jgi:hypothetical protein
MKERAVTKWTGFRLGFSAIGTWDLACVPECAPASARLLDISSCLCSALLYMSADAKEGLLGDNGQVGPLPVAVRRRFAP